MSMLNTPPKRFRLLSWAIRIGVTVIVVGSLWPQMPNILRYAEQVGFHPHTPDLTLFASIPPQVKLHIAAAVAAFVIGLVILLQPKGSPLHKTLGWAWVIAMAATAISSFFITGLNGNSLSFIHLISGWTVVALPLGIYAIRNRQVLMHKRAMTSLFVGGLVIAGALTFIPGRLMYRLFFG
ncbi:MAG: DUF2306 domain-containing protein [Proteobacteria bacterium]|nr:DUF2306 domain-containing protein [Pseudomonadota bacterium]